MFNIGFGELILILLVAFLIVGPKDLPRVARALGRFVKYLRSKWAEFIEETDMQDTLDELKGVGDDLKGVQDDLTKTVREVDPSVELRKTKQDIDKSFQEIKQAAKIKKPPVDR